MKFHGFIDPGGWQQPPAFAPGVAVRASMEINMFKSTSDHSQFAQRNGVLNGRLNGHGIDETAFADGEMDEKTRLVLRKKRLEKAAFELKLRIGDASARRKGVRPGTPTNNVTFQKWASDRKRMLDEIGTIDAKLLQIRLDAEKVGGSKEEREKRFERIFMQMAKDMLAGPVYDRIVAAAIHRAQDDFEAGDK